MFDLINIFISQKVITLLMYKENKQHLLPPSVLVQIKKKEDGAYIIFFITIKVWKYGNVQLVPGQVI